MKSKFNTMLFELFSNKCLVELPVIYPMFSAAQPTLIFKNIANDNNNNTTALPLDAASCPDLLLDALAKKSSNPASGTGNCFRSSERDTGSHSALSQD